MIYTNKNDLTSKNQGASKPTLIVVLIAGFILGILTQRYLLPQDVTISYISQSEMLELEKTRLKAEDLPSRQLFLGKPAEAIRLIEELQANRTNKHNIVLISEKVIYGKRVKSISSEVHQEIIKHLQDEKAKDAK